MDILTSGQVFLADIMYNDEAMFYFMEVDLFNNMEQLGAGRYWKFSSFNSFNSMNGGGEDYTESFIS